MQHNGRSPVLWVTGALILLMGLGLGVGGVWLAVLGGSWYYIIAAAGFLLTAYLLFQARAAALWVYAAVVIGTLGWALWEAGLDWWPLAARGGVIFLLGLFLLTPWVTRKLDHSQNDLAAPDTQRQASAFKGAGLPLTGVLGLSLAVAAISWSNALSWRLGFRRRCRKPVFPYGPVWFLKDGLAPDQAKPG